MIKKKKQIDSSTKYKSYEIVIHSENNDFPKFQTKMNSVNKILEKMDEKLIEKKTMKKFKICFCIRFLLSREIILFFSFFPESKQK